MQTNWKLKSFMFGLIDSYNLHNLHYFAQKYITKRSSSQVAIKEIDEKWIFHAEHLKSLDRPVLIEFGAGKNLRQNIYLSQFCSRQIVVDVFSMLDIEHFNEAARQISRIDPKVPYTKCDNLADIKNAYSIDYRAPFDMTKTGLEDSSVDCCVSTSTMEHVPEPDLKLICSELFRIIKNGGIISAIVDYSDHYSHTDKNIEDLNFLQFSEKEWQRYNHKSHSQNRLRHYDYQRIFKETGFSVELDEPSYSCELPAKVSSDFDVSNPTVRATKGLFLLRVIK